MERKIKTVRGLASLIAKREGKKSQARIGDIREILSIVSDVYAQHGRDVHLVLIENGRRRALKAEKK